MKCEYCGRYNPPGNTDCKYCNAPLPVPLKPFDTPAYIAEACAHFGTTLGETSVFCEICGHISPAVHENIRQNPQKKSLDYIGVLCDHHGHQYIDCPHCGKTHRSAEGFVSKKLDTPIVICKQCHLPFIDPCTYEWSVISPVWKLYFCFVANSKWMTAPLLLLAAILLDISSLYWILPATFLICTVNLCILNRKKLHDSKQRLENNAQYIDLLKRLGYEKLPL
ncbi:MAG: hypothetical protein J6J04_05845 [Oscillospiraceae bacterium]|nr:hypothetical protein [Oscillospiraceae bacterium]